MVNRLLAGTFLLHLRGRGRGRAIGLCSEDSCPHTGLTSEHQDLLFFFNFCLFGCIRVLGGSKWELPLCCKDALAVAQKA